MSDDHLIRRGDAIKAVDDWQGDWSCTVLALSALPAVRPRVKPLLWDDADQGICTKWRAAAFQGHYELVTFKNEKGWAVNFSWGRPFSFWFIQGDGDDFGPTGPKMFPDLEAAKAAAQADYEARILSALDNNNTGKEVMTIEPNGSAEGPRDTGPGDQAVAGAAGPFRASPRDWTEDFAYENGSYMCRCFTCGEQFFGYKRRVTCRVCAQPSPERKPNE
jgi:hypothetical protein